MGIDSKVCDIYCALQSAGHTKYARMIKKAYLSLKIFKFCYDLINIICLIRGILLIFTVVMLKTAQYFVYDRESMQWK